MNIEKIKTILETKDHNVHYLNRYINFISNCIKHNSVYELEYIEKHHICPKGKNFFPLYSNFKKHPWNKAELSPRQHLIAHYMLAKAYGGYAWNSYYMMVKCVSKFNIGRGKVDSKLFEYVKKKYKNKGPSRESIEKVRIKNKGKTNFKDNEGNIYFLDVNDDFIKSNNLVGITKGCSYPSENNGFVVCRNTITNEIMRVTKSEFDINDSLVGISKGNKVRGYKAMKSTDGEYMRVPPNKIDYYLSKGFTFDSGQKGKNVDYIKDTKWMNNGVNNARVKSTEIQHYIENGYSLGRIKFKHKIR